MNGPGRRVGGEGEEANFHRLSAQLVERLFVLVKLAQVHHMENRAVAPALERFMDRLQAFHREVDPEFHLQLPDDGVYVNRRLLRADAATWERARQLRHYFRQFEIGEVGFGTETRIEAVRDFLQAVREGLLDPGRLAELRERHFLGISFRELHAVAAQQGRALTDLPPRVRVLRAFGLLVATIEELVERMQRGRRAALVPVRRAAQELAQLPDATLSLQMGLLSLRQLRDTLAGRLAFVGVVVMLMGRRLGRPRRDLRDLCVAAALAGVGRAISAEFVFAPPDKVAAARAFFEGAGWLLPSSGVGLPAALRLVAAVGQQQPAGRRHGHLVARMTAVADAYERLTAPEPLGQGLPTDRAIAEMRRARDLDPDVVRLLVETVGLFPVGTTVRLSDGSMAIVVEPNPGDPVRPQVSVVADAQGRPVPRYLCDLADGELHIEATADPAEMNINVGHFLFA